jgi:hypothetical protein
MARERPAREHIARAHMLCAGRPPGRACSLGRLTAVMVGWGRVWWGCLQRARRIGAWPVEAFASSLGGASSATATESRPCMHALRDTFNWPAFVHAPVPESPTQFEVQGSDVICNS